VLEESRKRGQRLGAHGVRRLQRVEAFATPLGRDDLEIAVSDALEERHGLAFESIGVLAAIGASTGSAPQSFLHGQIEQQRQIGLKPSVHGSRQLFDELGADPAPTALIGTGRIRKSIANYPIAAREGGPNEVVEMYGTRGKHDQRLSLGG
jgi:hypothetical protein